MAILKSTRDIASVDEPGKVSLASIQEALSGLDTTKVMTPAATKAVIDALIDGAPGALDTLNELAAALNDDASYFQTIQTLTNDFESRIYNLENGLTAPPGSASQSELDATQAGAGLGTSGAYTPPSSSNYLSGASSLKDADSKLDAQIALNAAAISSLGSGNIASLQTEIDDTQSSVGLNSDGSFTAQSGNYIGSASTVRGEISALDTQVKSNADAIANMASSSTITALQSELDASQAGVGLASDGSHVSRSGSNYIDSATSVVGEITLLDGQIKTNADAIALKAASSDLATLQSTVSGHTSDIASNLSAIQSNDSDIATLQSDVSGKASQSDLTALTSRVTANEGDISTLNTESADYESRISSLESGSSTTALQTELDATQTGVGLASDGSHVARTSTNYLNSATSIVGEISALDVQVKSNADAIASNDSDIATLQSDVSGKASSVTVSSLQSEVDDIETSIGLGTDGSFTANSGGNYISSATSVRGEINALDTQLATTAGDLSNLSSTVSTLTSGSSSNATDIAALQSEVDTTQAGAGLGTTGAYGANSGSNYIASATSLKDADDKLDAQIKTNADAIALKASSSDLSTLTGRVSTNESDISSLQTDVSSNTSDIAANLSAIQSNDSDISALQSGKADSSTVSAISTELTSTQASVGLNTDGTYSAHSSSNYINSASTVKGALGTLDGQIKSNADAIASNDTDIATNASGISTLDALANTHEASIGLSTSGGYQSRSGSNYIDSATTIRGEITLLDSQAKTNADAIATEVTNRQNAVSGVSSTVSTLQSEVDDTQTGAGLGSDGSYTANSGANYIASATSLKDADNKLDTQIKANADAIATNATDIASLESDVASLATSSNLSALQTEVDAIEAGAGLSSSGAYSANGSANYISAATSLKDADNKLDAQIKTNADAIASNDTDISNLQSLANTHEASIGLNGDGSYTAISGYYAVSSASLKAAVGQLDTQVKSNADAIALKASSSSVSALQTEVDNVESAVGLAADGTFSSFSGQNYLNSATTIKGGLELLDAAIKTRQDNIDTEASARASADTTLTNAINTVEASVGLQADGSLSITGTNYLNSSSTIVAALDTLDTNQKYLRDVQDNLRGTVGSGSTGLLGSWSSSNYIGSDTSLKAAIESLDAQVSSNASSISSLGSSNIANLQTEIDDTQAAVGLDSNGDYVSRSGTNYLDSATSIVGEISALDTQVKSNADNIALKANSTTLSALDLRVTQLETGGGGILLDHASDDAVEMDDTLSEFKSHSGPFQFSFASLISGGTTDLIFYGSKGERDGDRHFAIHPTTGDAIFAGKYS